MVEKLSKAEIDNLVADYPLPEGAIDALLNRQELADALDVSANTVSAWIAAGMPVVSDGKNGQSYELRLAHCHAWRCARDRAESEKSAKAREAIAAMRLALTGGKPGNTLDALSPADKKEAIAAAIEYEKFQRTRNEMIGRQDAVDLLEQVFMTLRDALGAMPDALERENVVPVDAIPSIIQICDDTLDDISGQISRFWQVRPLKAADADENRALFDA